MSIWPSSYGPPNMTVVLASPTTPPADSIVSRHLSLSLFQIPAFQPHRRHMSIEPNSRSGVQKNSSVWPCHRSVLVSHSTYFAALLEGDFQESQTSTAFLPQELSDPSAIKCALEFMYTHKIRLSCSPKKHLQLLQNTYLVADYLDIPLLRNALLEEWELKLHSWTCNCSSCSSAAPLVLQFAREYPHDEALERIHQKIRVLLTHDPDKALCAFWTEKSLASLLESDNQLAQSLHRAVIDRISQHNAIESLYACFVAQKQLAKTDPPFSWSEPLQITLAAAEARATQIIASHFDFYCSSYPALLSCIDGVTYSFDFLEYLLTQIIEDEMDCTNAGVLYQGIVRDLMGRQEVESHEQVNFILQSAKYRILCFVASQFSQVKQANHLCNLDSDILQQLAKDLTVPPRSIVPTWHASNHSKQSFFSFLSASGLRFALLPRRSFRPSPPSLSSHPKTFSSRLADCFRRLWTKEVPRHRAPYSRSTSTFSGQSRSTFSSRYQEKLRKRSFEVQHISELPS